MTVYHGSDREIPAPDVFHSRRRVDFGPGFYVTPLREQAINWAKRFKRSGRGAIVSEYELADQVFLSVRALRFEAYDEAWLNCVAACRRDEPSGEYDLVMGGVANDNVFDTIELFFDGLIDQKTALQRLIYQKPNYQICIRSQKVIDHYLRFKGSERL